MKPSDSTRTTRPSRPDRPRMQYGVGSHEPIFHRLRSGNAAAEEWERWNRETSTENLDLLERLGVGKALIACTKGFGLEFEKPLIERAARFAERAARRGIRTGIYVQGFPVYYETFLLEKPEAEAWLARRSNGDYIPYGGQTFRRYMDPARREFHEYEHRMLEYVLRQFTPCDVFMDNTLTPACWSAAGRESFRDFLRQRYRERDLVREFGIPSFEAVDLPCFDPIAFPMDAYVIVKDPLLQEWAQWRSRATADFVNSCREVARRLAPGVRFSTGVGCDALRHNLLFVCGGDFEDRLAAADRCWMEESGWRPGAIESDGGPPGPVKRKRRTDTAAGREGITVRVSTDSRWWKIASNYGMTGHGGFWGETDRAAKRVALSHNLAFAGKPHHLGVVGPLAAAEGMLDDIADVVAWGNEHMQVLAGREERIAPIAVWRSTRTTGFIRHTPVWEACAVEQMLYEQHLPFTILLDGGLKRFLAGRRMLILPGAQCVSDEQVEIITRFVQDGGAILLLGPSGTRDERTRVRRRYAFEHLFGGGMPNLESYGPPGWVPEMDWRAAPLRLAASCGRGHAALVKDVIPRAPLDLTRDPYMPERQVHPKDVLPPANEREIMETLLDLLRTAREAAAGGRRGPGAGIGIPHVTGPRWTLCEYWRRGRDLVVCCANLSKTRPGGPLALHLGPCRAAAVTVHTLPDKEIRNVPVRNGVARIGGLKHFCAVEAAGVF